MLFYGSVNAYRADALERLRRAGLLVRLANPDGDVVSGGALHDAIAGAKIVLNLRYRGDDNEWKLTRLLPLLANARFVLSEMCGHATERARFAAGLLFAHSTADLVRQALHYADAHNAPARRAVAAAGCAISRQLREADVLRDAIGDLPGMHTGTQ